MTILYFCIVEKRQRPSLSFNLLDSDRGPRKVDHVVQPEQQHLTDRRDCLEYADWLIFRGNLNQPMNSQSMH